MVIAGIYEIQNQIGAGGGGIVYLGRHLRLNKQVVLKADKRTLRAKPELLRREVDMLKGLSHTYIPQVYDFVQENGVVYTVMDYIEGESLDKLLKRGESSGQPQIIRWACQLLEALDYLHSRPPHGILHGDIKPANIMLRPDGTICLIDYNIALALGENGAVRAGFSRGYASPEHYGIEYADRENRSMDKPVSDERDSGISNETETARLPVFVGATETMGETETLAEVVNERTPSSDRSSTKSQSAVLLDVSSDIYSLGATLYHLLSGRRPPQNVKEVEPLGPEVCSPEVSRIIQKAMAPDPDMRYQSAAEMLMAFRQLHKRDRRMLRHKKRIVLASAVLSVLFLAGGACTFTGLKQLEQIKEAMALAEYSANCLTKGDRSGAVSLALEAIPTGNSLLEAPATAQAQKALTDALGVYDLSDGFKALDSAALPSAPFMLAVSPDGSSFAAVCQSEADVFDLESGQKLAGLPTQDSALAEIVFLDENRIVYAGKQGVTAYDLETETVLWSKEPATTLAVSGDRNVVAAVNRDEDHAVLYRASDGEQIGECSFEGRHMETAFNDIFANPGNRIFSLNETGELLAVSLSGGGLRIFDWKNPGEDMILYEETAYERFEGGFCGKYFAFAADKSDQSLFGLIDTKEGVYTAALESRDPFYLKADGQGIYLANGNLLVRLDVDTLEEKELAYTNDRNIIGFSVGEEYVLTATDDKGVSFYDKGANLLRSVAGEEACDFALLGGEYAILANRNEPVVRLWKRESHMDTRILSYDARYAHDEARIGQNGETAMLFSYQDFCIFDREGRSLIRAELPEAESIYDQQFVRDGENAWLEVIWYDGMVRRYDAEKGTLLSEEKGEPPARDLYEEFFTDRYRIASSLHGAPEAFDRKSGRKVATLEEESYLTYVTQVGDSIITEYVSAEGERYGLLLNDRLETLAYLPGLCDVVGEMLVFDYGNGDLRQSRLYSLRELVALGENYLENENEKGENEV